MNVPLSARRFLPLVALLCALVPSAAAAPPRAAVVTGEILVRPRAEAGPAVEAALEARGLSVLERSLGGLLRVRVPAGTEDRWIDEVRELGTVAYVERNGIGGGGAAPNDTWFGEQWHLQNTGQGGGTTGADIQAVAAWDTTTGSRETVIAILDTGLDLDHPEFIGRIDPDGWDFVAEDAEPAAEHPHGTQVAGCAAASGDNSFGVSGVDRQCHILPIRVLDENNLGMAFDLVQGIEYAAAQADVDIVSLSLINYSGSQSLLEALVTARNAGKIVIACAGNNGIGNADVSQPGASAMTISVGATDHDDQRWSGSGTGLALDLVAPGRNVVTAVDGTNADTFTTVTGCSYATPVTAGVAGLLLSRADELGVTLDHDAVKALLLGGAEDQVGPAGEDLPGRDDAYGAGRINANASLELLEATANCDGLVSIGLPDCDGDGVSDACAIGEGAADCNENGLPDACETGTPLIVSLARRGPVGAKISQQWSIADPRPAASTVSFTVTARADLDASFEFLTISANDVILGMVFTSTGESCSSATVSETLMVDPLLFNVALDGAADLDVEVIATGGVSALDCNGSSFVEIEIAYTSGPTNDADGDGIPNDCEPCPADVTGDGGVGFGDLTALLNAWGPCAFACAPDLDGDGTIGFGDLTALLNAWGPCAFACAPDLDGDGTIGFGDLGMLLVAWGSR